MTDHQLRGFMTVVEKKSFTAAAEALFISQSALSQQIRSLERHLGFDLFDRRTRQPTLTEAGRSFYDHAQKIQKLYDYAISEGKQLHRMGERNIKRFVIGYVGDQFMQIWQDLLLLALPLTQRYAYCLVRYSTREALYTAILREEVQMAALLENEDIRRFRLQFFPFARVTELCMPAGPPLDPELLEDWTGARLALEDLRSFQLAFHNPTGYTLYEDLLRAQLWQERIKFVDPQDFHTAGFRETILLVPAVQYSGHGPVFPLDWHEGPTMGFVTAPGGDPRVPGYAEYIRTHLQPRENFWTPLG